MSLEHPRSFAALLVGLLSAVTVVAGSAQRVFAYSEPTVCSTFFMPNSGLTFHAGGAFSIGWSIAFPQFGPVTYRGQPNPAYSTDGMKKWSNPTANVTCFIDWYHLYPTPNMDASYRWHINDYGGTVSSCDGGGGSTGGTSLTNVEMDPGYDPYDTFDPGGGSCGEPGTTGSTNGGGGGFVCHTEFIYIEISYDGGITWEGWWEGNATVCDS